MSRRAGTIATLVTNVLFAVCLVTLSAQVTLTAERADIQADAKLALFQKIQRLVTGYAFFTVFDDITVSLDDEGGITLGGHVTAPHKRRDIADRVAAVDGITVVTNEIAVLPLSGFDNELRYRVARATYGNASFWHYAARLNPPIHIVVNRGHVTLTGVVDSDTDRLLARILANQFGAFSVTSELQLASEAAAQLEQL
jgi:hyperosmotically inducible protein